MNELKTAFKNAILHINDVDGLYHVSVALQNYADALTARARGISIPADIGPAWYQYEMILRDTCRDIIDPIFKDKKLRGWNVLIESILTLCQNKKYGKGRQLFVTLIGKYGGAECVSALGNLIDDDDVVLHAIDALTKRKDLSCFEKIKRISEGEKSTPARSYARKYMKKMVK